MGKEKKLRIFVGIGVFVVVLIVYLITLAPSTSF
ncbi:unnamed protein product, partial [marine sediment metagenome]